MRRTSSLNNNRTKVFVGTKTRGNACLHTGSIAARNGSTRASETTYMPVCLLGIFLQGGGRKCYKTWVLSFIYKHLFFYLLNGVEQSHRSRRRFPWIEWSARQKHLLLVQPSEIRMPFPNYKIPTSAPRRPDQDEDSLHPNLHLTPGKTP